MILKKFDYFQSELQKSKKFALVMLILRIEMGMAFIFHGWPKIQAATTWMGPEAPIPGLLQALAALAEFGGGIAILLGLLTPLASLGLIITMTVAATFHLQKGDPFVGQNGSYELASVYWAISLTLLLLGPGCLSLDKFLMSRCCSQKK